MLDADEGDNELGGALPGAFAGLIQGGFAGSFGVAIFVGGHGFVHFGRNPDPHAAVDLYFDPIDPAAGFGNAVFDVLVLFPAVAVQQRASQRMLAFVLVRHGDGTDFEVMASPFDGRAGLAFERLIHRAFKPASARRCRRQTRCDCPHKYHFFHNCFSAN